MGLGLIGFREKFTVGLAQGLGFFWFGMYFFKSILSLGPRFLCQSIMNSAQA